MRAVILDGRRPCEAEVSDQTKTWRNAGDHKCQNHARYMLEDKRLCGKHASQLALAILLRE